MGRRRGGLLAACLVAVLAAGCSGPGGDRDSGGPGLPVVTTTTQVTDFAGNVGGDRVDVYQHPQAQRRPARLRAVARPTSTRIAEADVVVKNGVGLEKWFDDTIESAEPKGTIVDASSGVDAPRTAPTRSDGRSAHLAEPAQRQDHGRPTSRSGPGRRRPRPHAAAFEANVAAYAAQLDALDADDRARRSPR